MHHYLFSGVNIIILWSIHMRCLCCFSFTVYYITFNSYIFPRPQKGRAYVQNLLPCVTRMARRPEEPLLDTLATALDKIMPALGHFTNDNEVKNLLKAFLLNLNHASPAIRRSAVSSLVALCRHSRKPPMFLGWLLGTVLQMLVCYGYIVMLWICWYFMDILVC